MPTIPQSSRQSGIANVDRSGDAALTSLSTVRMHQRSYCVQHACPGCERLWAAGCIGLSVTGNIFGRNDRNGRGPNGPEPHYVWNADITINEADGDPTDSPTRDDLVSDNIVTTRADRIAASRVDTTDTMRNIVIRGNLLWGDHREVLTEGTHPSAVTVAAGENKKLPERRFARHAGLTTME